MQLKIILVSSQSKRNSFSSGTRPEALTQNNYSSKNWHNYLKLCPCVHPKMCVRAFSHHSSFHVSGSLSMASTKGISTAQVWTRYVQSSQRKKCACWMSSLMWVTHSFSPSLYCILSQFWKLPISEADCPVTLFEDFLFGLCHHNNNNGFNQV